MKAPDKVYVCIPSRVKSDSADYVGIAFSDRGHLTTPQIEEYIRKDALLEWAKETLEIVNTDRSINEGFRKGAACELEEVINHIKTM